MLGCHNDKEMRHEAAQGEERTGQYHTKSYRSYRTNADLKKTQPGKQGCKNKTGKKLLRSLFLCFFFNLKSWTVDEGKV